MAAIGTIQPAIRKLAHSDAFLKSGPPENKAFLLTAPDFAVYSPEHPAFEELMQSVIQPRMDLVFWGQKKASEALKEIAEEVNRRLDQK